MSWNGLAHWVAGDANLDTALIRTPERGAPSNNALSSGRGLMLRPLDRAIDDFMEFCAIDWREAA